MRPFLASLAVALLARGATAHFADDQIWVVDYARNKIWFVNPNKNYKATEIADSADGLNGPGAITFSRDGQRMLVSNYLGNQVLEFDPAVNAQVVLTSADGLNGPAGGSGIAVDRNGRFYVANSLGQQILRFDEDYQNGTVFADAADGIVQPDGLAFLADGNLLVANRNSGGTILLFDASGNGSTWDVIAGENPLAVTLRNTGDVYVLCDNGNLYRYLGGSAANRVLLGTYGFGSGSIRFDSDFTTLYHVNNGDKTLRKIDPDTGVAVSITTRVWDCVALCVVGSQYAPGTFAPIGDGVAGAGGLQPTLGASGSPAPGGTVTLQTRDFVGGARSLLFVGADNSQTAFYGGDLYIDFSQWWTLLPMRLPGTPGVPGEGDLDQSFSIPADNALLLTQWFFQHTALDDQAPGGMAITSALLMYLGA